MKIFKWVQNIRKRPKKNWDKYAHKDVQIIKSNKTKEGQRTTYHVKMRTL